MNNAKNILNEILSELDDDARTECINELKNGIKDIFNNLNKNRSDDELEIKRPRISEDVVDDEEEDEEMEEIDTSTPRKINFNGKPYLFKPDCITINPRYYRIPGNIVFNYESSPSIKPEDRTEFIEFVNKISKPKMARKIESALKCATIYEQPCEIDNIIFYNVLRSDSIDNIVENIVNIFYTTKNINAVENSIKQEDVIEWMTKIDNKFNIIIEKLNSINHGHKCSCGHHDEADIKGWDSLENPDMKIVDNVNNQ